METPSSSSSIISQSSKSQSLKTLNSLSLYKSSLSSLSLPIQTAPKHHSSVPLSKQIPKTHFLVDAFRFSTASTTAYFLTHFHSDHYSGLSSNWSQGVIFCSQLTADLLIRILNVNSRFVYPLNLNDTVVIDGSQVTVIDANHCPGAVQFLFKVKSSDDGFEMYVHTGDFRFCSEMKDIRVLSEFVGCDALFLDTTYCNPKFVFPKQEESVDYVVGVIERIGGEFRRMSKDVLFLVATYVVGKEKILIEIAKRCKRKVLVDARKMEVLRVLGYGEDEVFTEDESESDVHVVGWNLLGETWPYFRPNFVNMKEIMVERGYSRVIGFVPTGWTYEVKHNKFSVRSKDSFEIHLVPYSEHSNYDELREYVKFLRPKRVVPTVGVDIESLDSKQAIKMQKHFAGLVDEMANKKQFLMGFFRGSPKNDEKAKMEDVSDLKDDLDRKNEAKPSDLKVLEDKAPDIVLNSTSTLQQPVSQTLIIPSEEETEKIIKEVREFLPPWVTRDQMLDLIGRSGGNLVDAISNFHERETEFHQQVFSCKTTISHSQIGSINDLESLSRSVSIKNTQDNLNTPSIQNCKSSNPFAKPSSIESSVSPAKKRRNVEKKSSKKVKFKPKLESGGHKQPTITSFFSRLVPGVSQGSAVGLVPDQCPIDENIMPNDDLKSYKEEIDQFVQIINGNEASKDYAATILGKTEGDTNKALDMYYGNPTYIFGESVERLVAPDALVEPQCHTNECSSSQDKILFGEESRIDLSLQKPSTENLATDYVRLPTEKYDPVKHACWRVGEPAPYIHLARTFNLVEAEKGKIKATSMMCNMFRSLLALSPENVLPAVYLCTNKIAADHENIELNIGGSLVTSALEEACGTNRCKIRDMYNSLGDLGDVAQVFRQTQALLAPPPPLLIKDVFSVLRKISVQTGSGSTARKKSLIVNLMRSCREMEMKFIVRTLVRNLRIGAMMKTVLPALAQAVALNSLVDAPDGKKGEFLKEKLQYLSAAVVEAYNILPNLDLVVPSLISKGIEFSTSDLSMVPGIPIKPMLARITNGVSQVLKLFQDKAFTCEYKYDGQRAQIHKLPDGSIHVFSRNGDETTSRFPDLIDIIEQSCKPDAVTFIVDAEVVGVDRKNGHKLMSFQELSSRERGGKDSSITLNKIKVQICVFVFDIMFANSEQLLDLPLRQRRKRLKDLFGNERKGYFEYAKEMTVESHDACSTNGTTETRMSSFLEDALQHSCEGIMVKTLDVQAEYLPSKRTDTWLKVKRDYVEELNDSLDLVPIGAWHGNGRKAGWYSPFLMACYNPDTEEFQSVCRVMSGFSDAFYSEMKEFFLGDRILLKKPPYYRTAEVPDKWFSAEVVWEIRGAEFTISPVHEAAVGLVHPSRGISMRFPRFIRCVSDRNPEQCSTAEEIAEMFNSQTRKMDVTAAN